MDNHFMFHDACGVDRILMPDDRKTQTGYYYGKAPYAAILFCAESGRWYEWKPEAQIWVRAQEWCRRRFEHRDQVVKILPPEALPSPDGLEAEEKIAHAQRIAKNKAERPWAYTVYTEKWWRRLAEEDEEDFFQ